MSLKKILMKGTTRISLHERFTFLRNQSPPENRQTVHLESVRQGLFRDQQASARNRRLAQMMDRRPTVMAALKLKKRILKQRLGQVARPGLSVKDRLSLRGRGGLRGRIGQRGLSALRSQQVLRQSRVRGMGPSRGGRVNRGSLSRSQSISNLSNTGRGGGRFQNRNFNTTSTYQEFRRGGRGRGLRSRGRGGFNRNRDDFQPRRGGGFGRFNTRGYRSRGGFRGRRAGRGRGRGGRPPTREELDSQLDQYMAGSRGVLDRELDSYMTRQEEAWD